MNCPKPKGHCFNEYIPEYVKDNPTLNWKRRVQNQYLLIDFEVFKEYIKQEKVQFT